MWKISNQGGPDPKAWIQQNLPSADVRDQAAKLADLAAENGLKRLSMGTTQDFEVAVAEGATIVRLGTVLYS